MECNSSFLLDENFFNTLSENKRQVFILEWLINLDGFLQNANNAQIKDIQKKLVDQLVKQIHNSPGCPTRKLIGKCLATIFSIGDTFLLFDTVNTCNDILKNKDDSPSFLPTKLTCIISIGCMYKKLGRLMGRSYEETVNLLLKGLKNAESQLRCEIYITLCKIIYGMNTAASSLYRDIFKAIKHGLTDRVLSVRNCAAKCLQELIKHAPFLYTTDLENVFSLCFRSLENSNYEVRCSIAQVLGTLVSTTQNSNHIVNNGKIKIPSVEELLSLLANGFLRGGLGGFLKTGAGEMIKGGSTINKEVRIGVSHAYVVVMQHLGNKWVEKNLLMFHSHVLTLLTNPKVVSTHMDAVYSRRCVSFILSTVSKSLSEKAQIEIIKVLITIMNKTRTQSLSEASSNPNSKDPNGDHLIQHVFICALTQIGGIFIDLNTCASSILADSSIKLLENITQLSLFSIASVRISAAWCLRCIAVSCPSVSAYLMDSCLDELEKNKSSIEAIHGHSFALSALIGASCLTPLGMPHSKGKLIFCVAEDLLRSASQNSRLSYQRTQSGWQLIGSIMTIGTSFVRSLMPRLLLIWKNSFPRNSKDLESEKSRGDAFTWQITLENRAGALAAMSSFIQYNKLLLTDDIIRRLLTPIDSAILMLTNLSSLFKNLGPSVKASSALVRLRLYEVLLLLPSNSYESTYTNLLRLLVSEFTLAENGANTTTSLLKNFCNPDDEIILGSWIQNTDHKNIEDQLQPTNASGSGALEHDITELYNPLDNDDYVPSPLPLGFSIINKSCLIFAYIFKFVANKHRSQMLTHFQECIKHTKVARQEAIQINVLTTLIGSLKTLAENKGQIGSDEIKNQFSTILFSMLTHTNPLIRCASSHGLGRLCQIVGNGQYVAETVQLCLEKLKQARDMLNRTGYSLAIGFIHRFVGSLGSNQNLNTTISLLLALSQDLTSPVVQLWSLHALTLIVDSGGPMFRPYIDATLQHALKLLNSVPPLNCDVHQSIGKLLSALITTIGPELQHEYSYIVITRNSLLTASYVMQNHYDLLVQSEAIGCLQQLHMFAPKCVNLSSLVPFLSKALFSSQLYLRKASVSCLFQFSQREAREVCQHASDFFKLNDQIFFQIDNDLGLPGILFSYLNIEKEEKLRIDVQKIITSLVFFLCTENLNQVIRLCKEVLTAFDSSTNTINNDKEVENDNDFDDDLTDFNFNSEQSTKTSILPKWKTKVFATQLLCKVIEYCENSICSDIHFNLAKAKIKNKNEEFNYLVLHLSDLIKMAFMTATSDNDFLKLEGLKALELIIIKFANVEEPEFKNHVILEQYQAQVGAALRPAFSPETPSHVTAMACQVCSAWIGSGVARDLNDLKRVHQLLVASLSKLQKDPSSTVFNESSITLEKLAILKAWAEVYIVAMKKEENKEKIIQEKLLKIKLNGVNEDDEDNEIDFNSANNENILELVKPELNLLSENWFLALKDYAFLTLPSEYSNRLPHDGGSFYSVDTIDLAIPLYQTSWSSILHAACLWLKSTGFDEINPLNKTELNKKNFYLLFGIALAALCNPKSNEPLSYITECLGSLEALLSHKFCQDILSDDKVISVELCSILHRLLITRENLQCQQNIINVAHLIVDAQLKQYNYEKKQLSLKFEVKGDDQYYLEDFKSRIGETFNDDLPPKNSLAYLVTELTLSVLVRQLPELSQILVTTPGMSNVINNNKKNSNQSFDKENCQLIGSSVLLLSKIPELCTPSASIYILPTVLYLITGVLKECQCYIEISKFNYLPFEDLTSDTVPNKIFEPISSIFKSLMNLCSSEYLNFSSSKEQWIQLMQSTLAKILDICKSCENNFRPSESIFLTLICIFILKSPKEVLQPANLKFPCINYFKQALENSNLNIKLKCLDVLSKIFNHDNNEVTIPYIHSLAPGVIQLVNNMIEDSLNSNLSKVQYKIIVLGLQIIENLIKKSDIRLNLLLIYLPLLIKLLENDSQLLHNHALQKLVAVGPLYPQEFRQIIGQVSVYRKKLENAIKNSQKNVNSGKTTAYNLSNQKTNTSSNIIQLKTDFSNYS